MRQSDFIHGTSVPRALEVLDWSIHGGVLTPVHAIVIIVNLISEAI